MVMSWNRYFIASVNQGCKPITVYVRPIMDVAALSENKLHTVKV